MRFGIGYDREHTLGEIAQQFNLSRERVRQMEAAGACDACATRNVHTGCGR